MPKFEVEINIVSDTGEEQNLVEFQQEVSNKVVMDLISGLRKLVWL